MAYDPSHPIDSTSVGQLPGAIRDKGENLKALLEEGENINFEDAESSTTYRLTVIDDSLALEEVD